MSRKARALLAHAILVRKKLLGTNALAYFVSDGREKVLYDCHQIFFLVTLVITGGAIGQAALLQINHVNLWK
jgi:hypothetical protein